jgi:hypothetical protein
MYDNSIAHYTGTRTSQLHVWQNDLLSKGFESVGVLEEFTLRSHLDDYRQEPDSLGHELATTNHQVSNFIRKGGKKKKACSSPNHVFGLAQAR